MDHHLAGREVELQVYERGNCQSDTLMMLLHGGPGSGARAIMGLPAFQHLEKHYHCIYFDQRGSGDSLYDLTRGLLIDQIVQDVMQVITFCKERWKPKRVILWGGSFGGTLACLTMERNPDVADALILSSPALWFSRHDACEQFYTAQQQMEQRLSKAISQPVIGKLTPEEVLQDPTNKKLIFSAMNPSNSLRHIQAMSSWFYRYNYTACFTQLKVNTLVLFGEDDVNINVRKTMQHIQACHHDNIAIQCFPSCGHAIFEDCTEAFVQAITAFLQAG